MATCVELGPGNVLTATATPPESCNAYIIQSQTDWLSQQSPLWTLTPEQGAEIAGAILMVWAIAYVFRLVIRALHIDESTTTTE